MHEIFNPSIINPSTYTGGNFFSNFFSKWQWSRNKFHSPSVNILINPSTPVLVNVDDPMTAVNDCPHLGLIVNKLCDMGSNGEWKCVDVNDEEKEYTDDKGLELLNNPNRLESREDFIYKYFFYKLVFANNFIRPIRGSSLVIPKAILHLPSEMMQIKMTGNFFDQTELSEIISKFILKTSTERVFLPEEIIYHPTNFDYTLGMGRSKIKGLKYPISNIMASLRSRNEIMVSKGITGILSSDSKDITSTIPMTDLERKAIENSFGKENGLYGSGARIKISNNALKWNPMSYPVRDMMFHESDEMDFQTLCDGMGINRRVFGGTKDSTFENQIQSEKATYQNTIQPIADSFANIITRMMNVKGKKYILDYDWLNIMKEDELVEAQESKLETDRLSILFDKGIISAEAWAIEEDIQLTGDGIPKTQPKQFNLPA
jgi:phage portal protein BeeE